MQLEVHRAGKTYYGHSAVLLNKPGRQLIDFLSSPEWQSVAAAMFLGLEEVRDRRFSDFTPQSSSVSGASTGGLRISEQERTRLLAQGISQDALTQFERLQDQLLTGRASADSSRTPAGIASSLIQRSGVPSDVWNRAGQELLEAIIPRQTGTAIDLQEQTPDPDQAEHSALSTAHRLGLSGVTLATDFPITTATFGFSRVDYRPDTCRLNPFPPDPDYGGRFPIFVDVVQADAILLRLDHDLVLRWLTENEVPFSLPGGQDTELSRRAFFVQLLDGLPLRQTIPSNLIAGRMVFGLLHTLSHLAVKQAALLCGLEGTSLSEYLLPRALTFALYSNHRFGATIGALSSLFEQSLEEWLSLMRSSRRCVYDPVCLDSGGTCHACSHLPETGCRYFNVNLSRTFLYGGGDVRLGFFDMIGQR